MEITKKFIADVRKHNRRQGHDEVWFAFEKNPEVEAVDFALSQAGEYGWRNNLDYVVQEAKKYLEINFS